MILKSISVLALTVVASAVLATGCRPREPVRSADTIYTGGDIVTVNDAQPSVEALAVKDGKILALGARADIEKSYRGAATATIDLGGKTLVPGFVDGHSHFMDALAATGRANVSAPPVGTASNAGEIVAVLQAFAKLKGVKPGELIVGYGYDENQMPKGQELTRDILDKAFPANAVAVIHVSSHGAVLNSLAFKNFGYTDGMPTPAGGVIARKPGTQDLDGLVMETGYLMAYAKLPIPDESNEMEAARAGQQLYAAAGITTAQEGATHLNQVAQLKRIARNGGLYIDVVSFAFMTDLGKILAKYPPTSFGTYDNRLKLGGCKIVSDGSPQGKTAFFTTPYLTGGPAGQKDWKGEPNAPQAEITAVVKICYDSNLPLLFHANGDAAIDSLLTAHEEVAAGSLDKDRRTTVIHAQFVRPDQLAKFKQYNFIPSFFTDHAFFFGDTHVLNRGKEQAYFLSPMKSAYSAGLQPANHTDYAVAPIDHMMVMWTAVNRVSRSGEVIGPDERATPMQALQAITINGARIYGEEASKGSLEPGKLADLVVLDKNPLKVDPMTIKDIKVVETIKEGKSIYKAT
jgi:predicted amidohydrolase YtcJ